MREVDTVRVNCLFNCFVDNCDDACVCFNYEDVAAFACSFLLLFQFLTLISNLLLLFLLDLFTHLGNGAEPLDHFFVAVVAVDFNWARFTIFVIEIELVDPIQFAVVRFRNFVANRTEKGFTFNDQFAFALAFLHSC